MNQIRHMLMMFIILSGCVGCLDSYIRIKNSNNLLRCPVMQPISSTINVRCKFFQSSKSMLEINTCIQHVLYGARTSCRIASGSLI